MAVKIFARDTYLRPRMSLKPSKYEASKWIPIFDELQQLRKTAHEYRIQSLRTLEAAGRGAADNTVAFMHSSTADDSAKSDHTASTTTTLNGILPTNFVQEIKVGTSVSDQEQHQQRL